MQAAGLAALGFGAYTFALSDPRVISSLIRWSSKLSNVSVDFDGIEGGLGMGRQLTLTNVSISKGDACNLKIGKLELRTKRLVSNILKKRIPVTGAVATGISGRWSFPTNEDMVVDKLVPWGKWDFDLKAHFRDADVLLATDRWATYRLQVRSFASGPSGLRSRRLLWDILHSELDGSLGNSPLTIRTTSENGATVIDRVIPQFPWRLVLATRSDLGLLGYVSFGKVSLHSRTVLGRGDDGKPLFKAGYVFNLEKMRLGKQAAIRLESDPISGVQDLERRVLSGWKSKDSLTLHFGFEGALPRGKVDLPAEEEREAVKEAFLASVYQYYLDVPDFLMRKDVRSKTPLPPPEKAGEKLGLA